ncbi:hypothetical protein [Bacteroides eggerthii]|uniref:hypothetical protein n=1 Tax=Bacteroides eggerthii TaxID=28111 RepID=UPI001558AADE|nr:hypothetical protein [Bacteroides eggerthii]
MNYWPSILSSIHMRHWIVLSDFTFYNAFPKSYTWLDIYINSSNLVIPLIIINGFFLLNTWSI